MRNRVYLDFDGVINIFTPGPLHGETKELAGDAVISLVNANSRRLRGQDPDCEIIWASHREEGVYFYTDQLGLPRHPHLVFTDPTGSKVKDIIAHYQANPCKIAIVFEDSLTSDEISELNQAGVHVAEFHNAVHIGTHLAGGEA